MLDTGQVEGFWEFSLRTYNAAGAAEACLALQDEHGADVNMILYCCWAGGRAAPLDEAGLTRALAVSRDWGGQVVQPLRSVRRWMKAAGCAGGQVDREACLKLRERVKALELAAEQLQQQALAALPLPPGGERGPPAIAANLRRYLEAIEAGFDRDTRDRLLVIVRAAYPQARRQDLAAFVAQLADP